MYTMQQTFCLNFTIQILVLLIFIPILPLDTCRQNYHLPTGFFFLPPIYLYSSRVCYTGVLNHNTLRGFYKSTLKCLYWQQESTGIQTLQRLFGDILCFACYQGQRLKSCTIFSPPVRYYRLDCAAACILGLSPQHAIYGQSTILTSTI